MARPDGNPPDKAGTAPLPRSTTIRTRSCAVWLRTLLKISLNGHPAEVIDGFIGDQRFFMGWAQVWRGKYREYEQIRRIKVDPHSPPSVRGVAPVKNQNAFFDAFDIKDGDKMFLAPGKRVTIW